MVEDIKIVPPHITRHYLILGYLYFVIMLFSDMLNLNSGLGILSMYLSAANLTLWMIADARNRKKPLLPVVQHMLLMTFFFSSVIYLIYSRGWRSIFIMLKICVLYFLTVFAFNILFNFISKF